MKSWEKPRLIVLVRSRPGEAILQYCKWGGAGYGPNENYGGCSYECVVECFDSSLS